MSNQTLIFNTKEYIKEVVNIIQWVQEYVEAVGEEHKKYYVDSLKYAMEQLMKIVKE